MVCLAGQHRWYDIHGHRCDCRDDLPICGGFDALPGRRTGREKRLVQPGDGHGR